jgi:hypothetical protein
MGYYQFNYPEASALTGAAEAVWAGSDSRITVQISVSSNLVTGLREFFSDGVDSVFITDSDIRHIKKYHGYNEEIRGQVNLTPKDFSLIPVVINEFDKIVMTDVDKLGNKRFLVSKVIENEMYVASIQRGKKKMGIRSFWIKTVPGAS